jgi:hypothetical protein
VPQFAGKVGHSRRCAIVRLVNRDDLRLAAALEGISESSCSLGEDHNESYCLGIAPGGWSVWYSERGRRNNELFYETEDEACSDLLLRLVNDPTTRAR